MLHGTPLIDEVLMTIFVYQIQVMLIQIPFALQQPQTIMGLSVQTTVQQHAALTSSCVSPTMTQTDAQ